MPKTIRVDADVHAALDRIRDTYGDRNYSAAIRRALRWKQIADAEDRTPKGASDYWCGTSR